MNLNKVFKNAFILLSGDVVAALLGLISFGILGRTLGVSSLGLFSVIITYVTLVDKFVNFQSWQALIKYCDRIKSNKSSFDKLMSFGLFIDIFSAVLAFSISIILCNFIADFFNWTQSDLYLIKVYSFVILFNIEGTPTAIFRIGNKFMYFSKKSVIIASIKLLLFAFGWYYSYQLDYFIYSILIAQIIGYIYFILNSLRYSDLNPLIYFNKSNVLKILRKNENFLSFLFISNIQSTLKLTTTLVDTLIVSKFIGNSEAGILQVAKQFAKIFTQISSPLYKSIYPELTSLWNKKMYNDFKLLIFKSVKFASTFSVLSYFIFLISGEFIILTYLGVDFINSYYLMLYYFIGVLIFVSSFPLSPAFLAMGYPKIPLNTTLISSLVFIFTFIFTYQKFGYLTVGISYAIMTFVWLLLNVFLFKTKMRLKI